MTINRRGHLQKNHQPDIIGGPLAGQDIYRSTISRTSFGGPSTGHLLKDHQQDINWRIISWTSTVGPSEGNRQQDIYWQNISRISTGRPPAGHRLEVHQQDIYSRSISRTSTDGPSNIMKISRTSEGPHLLRDHEKVIYCSTLHMISFGISSA